MAEKIDKPVWRLQLDGHQSGAWNMAMDEALLETCTGPVLRFYGWQPACLSLGYAQRAEREVDFEGCERLGVDWVRRPTGGRAILHETTELTYSLVAPVNDPVVGGSVLDSYRKISESLLAGLQLLGVEAEVAGEEQKKINANPATAACFDAPSAYEITCQGRKIIGSAQARRFNTLLQQGTILVTVDVDRLFTALKPPLRMSREEAIEQVGSRLIGISESLGRLVDFEEARQAFIEGFRRTLDIELVEQTPDARLLALTERLVSEKYTNPAWNMLRQRPAPAYN